MYISLLLHLIKTHDFFFFLLFYEKVGIVGGFEEKVGSKQKSRNSRKPAYLKQKRSTEGC